MIPFSICEIQCEQLSLIKHKAVSYEKTKLERKTEREGGLAHEVEAQGVPTNKQTRQLQQTVQTASTQ
jgi:hypothetical protein